MKVRLLCVSQECLKPAASVRNISSSDWHWSFIFIAVVVKCLGPANGISRSPCERAVLSTPAGPGPVDASGWSLIWKWDPTKGWTQGKRPHTHTGDDYHCLYTFWPTWNVLLTDPELKDDRSSTAFCDCLKEQRDGHSPWTDIQSSQWGHKNHRAANRWVSVVYLVC